jgi:hypothetical protein
MLVARLHTADGAYMVLVYDDQTAEVALASGRIVVDRKRLSAVTDWLAERGYEELKPDS